MRVIEFRSPVSRVGVFLVLTALLLSARTATAQFTAQVLLPPSDLPVESTTRAFAINSSGQVFGEALGPAGGRREPVLWTGGVPQRLPIPDGYAWDDMGGFQFLNDSGTVVSVVYDPGGPAYLLRVIVWQNGVPQIMPPPPPPQPPTSCSPALYYPYGLNNSGHVLFEAADIPVTLTCQILWIWDGTSSLPSSFQESVALNAGPTNCSPSYSVQLASSHLNDADHIALDLASYTYICPTPPCLSQPASWSARHLPP